MRKKRRGTAKQAEEISLNIINVAAEMFASNGYKAVSLRKVSDKVGISHGLIRHHIGSKESLWHRVSHHLYDDYQSSIVKILKALPKGIPPSLMLYLFTMRLFTSMMHSQVSTRLLYESVQQKDNIASNFLENNIEINNLIDSFNQSADENLINTSELKWHLLMLTYGSVCINPHLSPLDDLRGSTAQKLRLIHWEMVNKQMVNIFNIDKEHTITLVELDEFTHELSTFTTEGL